MRFIIRVIVTFVHETNGICLTSVEKTHVWDYKECDCVAQLRNKYHLLYVRVFTSSEDRCSGALYCLCLGYFKRRKNDILILVVYKLYMLMTNINVKYTWFLVGYAKSKAVY